MKFAQLLLSPWVAGISLLLGFFGVVSGFYFWWDAKAEPEIVALLQPIRATVVSADASSSFRIYQGDRLINGPLSAAQIAIWNLGKKPVKGSEILQPVEVRLEPSTPILSVQVKRQSREVVGPLVDESERENGIVRLRWNIMEQRDGIALQIIYLGRDDVKVQVTGAVEGQKQVPVYEGLRRENKKDFNWKKALSPVTIFALIGLAAMLVAMRQVTRNFDSGNVVARRRWVLVSIGIGVTMMISMVATTYLSIPPTPPFDF